MLQSSPDLANQLRQRAMTSGMTPDQIRSRLRAEGYPENFLDSYLPGGGSAGGGAPSADVISAFRRLGITDDEDASVLRTMLRQGSDSGAVSGAAMRPVLVQDDSTASAAADSAAYRLFGVDLFRGATSQFVPILDGPVDANYRLGPGDQLVLILTGEVELAHTLDVTREGFVVIPQVGQLSVANLTMGQLENLLYARLSRSYSGVRRGADAPTKFSVSMAKLRAIQVFVTGEVARPSSYRISSAATAMTAIYAAGGPTATGTMRAVTVRRGNQTVATLDVYDYLLRGDNARDVRLENGDVVFVGTHGPRVRVMGEVVRPATYELKAGEGVREAVRAAGGFKPTALTSRVQIVRILPASERTGSGSERVVLDVTADGPSIDAFPNIEIRGGDELRVFPVTNRVRSRITVEGHVWTPGRQAFAAGMKLSDALRAAGGTKPDAYLGQVAITRLQPDSTRLQLRAMLRDTTGVVVSDLTLADDDVITVYSLTTFRPRRFVAIGGSVVRSGRYPYHEGMTLRDLVLLAGGMREGAWIREAEIARMPVTFELGVTAQTLRVPLDSTYLARTSATPSASEVRLEAYDNVLIMQQPEFSLPRSVVITGEVRYPGRYALRNKRERVSDLIQRAGGLTPEAAVDGAYFARASELTTFERAAPMQDSLPMAARPIGGSMTPMSMGGARPPSGALLGAMDRRTGLATTRDTLFDLDTLVRAVSHTRVGVDLATALRRPGSTDNILLFDNDSLHLPMQRTTVEIKGAVNVPSIIAVDRARGINFYVRAAGGASIAGNARRAYVIQPNGKIEARRRILGVIPINPTPRAGATVVVPVRSENDAEFQRITSTIQIVAQTLGSLATVWAILR
jgi:protein involved in polysaccharide export with SLBB domain